MRLASVLLLVAASVACSADPPPKVDPPVTLTTAKQVTVAVGKKCVLTVTTTAKKVTWRLPAGIDSEQLDGKRLAVWATEGVYTLVAQVPAGDDVLSTEVILTVTGPRPPPLPPIPPTPPLPPVPPPQPVTNFLVMFVYESGDNLTPAEKGVIYGGQVEAYLTAACTGGRAGFARRDKDAVGETNPALKTLWTAIQPEFLPPKSTKTPAIAIQVNDKVEILPLGKTQAEMLATLKLYREGK